MAGHALRGNLESVDYKEKGTLKSCLSEFHLITSAAPYTKRRVIIYLIALLFRLFIGCFVNLSRGLPFLHSVVGSLFLGSVEFSWGLFSILVKYCLLRIMKNDYLTMLASLVLPAQILDYFLISGVEQTSEEIHIHLDEKMHPELSHDVHFESKGFMESVNVTDFPIRDHKVILKIRRRRWTDLRTGKSFSIPIDLDVVAKGTRYSKEFGAFLKETYGDIPSDLPYA